MRRRMAALALAALGLASAQTNTATIVGTVTDATGAVVPRAEVSAVHLRTQGTKTAQTNGVGAYILERLPVGEYTLTVKASGFKAVERTGIELDATQRAKIDLVIEVGGVTESVTITGGAPLVQTQNTELGVVIQHGQVANLPLNGRNFSHLIALQPGVVVSGGAVYFNGLTRDGVNITVDGTDASNPDRPATSNFGGQTQQNILSIEFIEEFKTTAGVFSAELGRAASGGVNVITRSGSNEFHGGVYHFLRNDRLDARNFFGATKDKLRLNQFGANSGGPVVRNKVFYFVGWEGVRERRGVQISGDVPNESLRQRMLAANPRWGPLLNLLPPPTETTRDPNIGRHRRSAARLNREDSALARLDYHRGSKDTFFARYTILDSDFVNPGLSPINGRAFPAQDRSATVSWTRLVSPASANEFRAGASKQDIPRADQAFVHQQIGNLGGYISTPGQEVLHANGGSWTLLDNFSYTRGRHNIRSGFELRRFHYGRANFENPVYTIDTLDDLLASRFNRVSVTVGNDLRRLGESQWGFYIQDDFRFNPRLTLNLGLRYEYYTPVKERDGLLFNVVDHPFGPYRPRGQAIWESDRNNFGPRFGLAWDVNGNSKNIIRAGGGVFYSPNTYREVTALVNPPDRPFRVDLTSRDFPNLRYPIDALNLDLSRFPGGTGRNIFDPFQRTTYSMQWSFDYQREFLRDLAFTAGYVGNRGLKLLTVEFLNEPDPAQNFQRPAPSLGVVSYQSHSDMSVYHSMQLSLRKRFSRGFQAHAHYTWGKALTIGGVDLFTASTSNGVQDNTNIRASRGRAITDITHIVSINYSWQMPLERWMGAGGGPGRVVASGWQLNGSTAIRSGVPFLLFSGRDNRGSGDSRAQRPDAVVGQTVKLDGYRSTNAHTFLNRAAFVDPCTARNLRSPCGVYGNVGKHVVDGPGNVVFNFSIFKNTKINEKLTLQFRNEYFNLFNRANFNSPGATQSRTNNANFGDILSADRSREIQFALKLLF